MTEDAFRASKGWFSCDAKCQVRACVCMYIQISASGVARPLV